MVFVYRVFLERTVRHCHSGLLFLIFCDHDYCRQWFINMKIVIDAFNNFDKWVTYKIAFDLMDQRKITLREIINIAEKVGIKPAVIKSRRRYFLQLKKV